MSATCYKCFLSQRREQPRAHRYRPCRWWSRGRSRCGSHPRSPYTISGRLTATNGQALIGFSITLSGAQTGTLVTGDGGLYSFTVNRVGDYTLTPTSTPYYTFVPQSFTNLHLNQTANFVGTRRTFTISGTLTDQEGNGLPGLTVNLTGARREQP